MAALRALPVAAFLLILLSARSLWAADPLAAVSVGQSPEQVLAIAGVPETRQRVVKTQAAIWGPEEDFWDEIPVGAVLERWVYPAIGGRYHLYYREGEAELAYKVFLPEGVVYESAPREAASPQSGD